MSYKIMNYAPVFRKIVNKNDVSTLNWFLSNPSLDFKENFNIDMLIRGKSSALHLAIANKNADMVILLLESGARIDLKNKDNENCLELAARIGEHDLVHLCLQSVNNDFIIVKYLEYPFPCNVRPLKKKVDCASKCDEYNVLKFLLKKGVDPNKGVFIRSLYRLTECTPLIALVCDIWIPWEDKYLPLVKLLIDSGANVNLEVLTLSFNTNNIKLINCLIDYGPKTRDNDFLESAVYLAVIHGKPEVLQKLIEMNVNVKDLRKSVKPRAYYETPLHSVFYRNRLATMKLLIEQGVDVNALDQDNETPLYRAASNNCFEAVKYLVKMKANVDGSKSRRPLFIAILNDNLEIVKFLISHGANLDFTNDYSRSILFYSIANREWSTNFPNVLPYLLGIGITVDKKYLVLEFDKYLLMEDWSRSRREETIKEEIENLELHQNELESMKKKKVCDELATTYYDVLSKRRNALVNCLRSKMVVSAIRSEVYEKMFPKYAASLKRNYLDGMHRMQMLKKFNELLHGVLSDDILSLVADYLSNDELIDIFQKKKKKK